MEHFKAWIKGHKALAIGGGLAIVVLLYILLRGSGSSQQAASPLNAYYAAQASGAASDASTAQSANALQASTNQTNAAEAVGLAQVGAASVPYQAQLASTTLQANLRAYEDYLTELNASNAGAGSFDAALFTDPTTGDKYVQTAEQVKAGDNQNLYDLTTHSIVNVASGITGITNSTPFTHGTFDPITNTFTPVKAATVPLQFGQFLGATVPNLAGTTPTTQPTTG